MTVTYGVHGTVHAHPGRGDELVALLVDLYHDECPVFLVTRGIDDPDLIYVIEGWTSEEAHTRVAEAKEAEVFLAKFRPLVAGEEITVALPVGGRAKF
ncbi:putative quinol monooxygenase [Dactylosporangium sp. CA-092794]|uniref:putative quinol monooxygenase n=1 Tax=Dactylosporangium sp. CA-092794 TaxID=3239929 RepID=UPI003D941059